MAEKALALDPQNSSYHLWLGRAMGRKAEEANPFTAFGLARKVKTEFERAVALDGNNLPARADLSEFYLEAPGFLGGDKNKAKQQADYVAGHDRALASYIYARVQEKQGNTGAEAEYKKAIAASSAARALLGGAGTFLPAHRTAGRNGRRRPPCCSRGATGRAQRI